MDCLFCKIINGDIPSYTVYENDHVKCFLDINPNSNGHTLIIPKKHNIDVRDLDIEYMNYILEAEKYLVDLYDQVLKPDGYKITQNNGIVQDVKHYHVHVIPVYKNEAGITDIKELYSRITNGKEGN